MNKSCSLLLTLCFSSTSFAASDAYVSARIMSAAIANKIATTAEQACKKKGYQVSVAVVDRYGNLISFSRDPLAGAHTIGIAKDKAYTAATFQGDTITLAKQLDFLKGTPHLSLVGGGIPVKLGGYMYGAVGVSGAPRDKIPGDVDHACAMTGIEAVKEALEFAE
jgi:uncharacterized protein GlcG (DUF336 family)